MDLLNLLRTARWLATGQIRRRFFPDATVQAARRRLRVLVRAGFLRKRQDNRMEEAIFAVGSAGKLALEREGSVGIALETRPPKQRDHMAGINDLRIAVELTAQVGFFFGAWELPAAGWRHPIIPDAVFRLGDHTFAAEFDCGTEGVQFFVRTKVAAYRSGFAGLPLSAVVVVADCPSRMEALMRAITDHEGTFRFTTIDAVREHGMLAPIFYRASGAAAEGLVGCFPDVFRRENKLGNATRFVSDICRKSQLPS